MFSRKKKQQPKTAPAAPQPVKNADTGNMKKPVRVAPSIISGDLVVTGNLVSGGEVQVDGTIDGDIRAASLVIGEQATITGEVMAEEVIVRGRIIGILRGLRIVLASSCHVEGDIMHESLAVEPGAYFEGNCRRSEDPLSSNLNAAVSPPAPAEKLKTAASKKSGTPRPKAKPRSLEDTSPVVVKDGNIVVRRPAAQ